MAPRHHRTGLVDRLRRSSCRSCSAPIAWAETATGSRIPLDVEPTADGNVTLEYRLDDQPQGELVTGGGPAQRARLVARVWGSTPAREIADHGPRFTSHFATCPQAHEWRHRR